MMGGCEGFRGEHPVRRLLACLLTVSVALACPAHVALGQEARGLMGVSREEIALRIMPAAARLRGLAFENDVPVVTTTPEEVGEYVRRVMDEEMPEKRFRGYEKVLSHMGLIEPGLDLRETLIHAYSTSIAGYYDDEAKSFSIVAQPGGAEGMDAVTVAHELVHALQDQHFDLSALRRFVRRNDDASLAVMALAEGDACDIMFRYMAGSYPRGGGPVRDYSRLMAAANPVGSIPGLPLVVAQNMMFPYSYGTRFVTALLEAGGNDAVNRAFLDPPVSTEQVIHPDKYIDRDEPCIVELPDISDLLGEGWEMVAREPLGQFNLGLFLAVHLGTWGVDEAIAGWEGDAIAGFSGRGDGDFVFVHFLAWESPESAGRIFSMYRRLVEGRFPAAEEVLKEDSRSIWMSEDLLYYLRRRGCDVLLVEGVPQATAGRVIAGLWNARKVPFGIARSLDERRRVEPSRTDGSSGAGGVRE